MAVPAKAIPIPHRAAQEWLGKLGPETSSLLDEDERYFLRQSLSTPCLDVVERAAARFFSTLMAARSSTSTATVRTRSVMATPRWSRR